MPCRACGVCCDLYGHTLSASPRDLARWSESGRVDLLAQVGAGLGLWFDPATGERLDHCPHFSWRGTEHGACGIHRVKPDVCRAYPTVLHNRQCVMGVQF